MTKLIVAFLNFAKALKKGGKKVKIFCLISAFFREAEENCTLPEHYEVSNVISLPTFRDSLSASSSRVKNYLFGFLILKMEPIIFPAMSIRNYHYLLRNSPEESSFQNNLSRRRDTALLICDR
jgi:hypothetical protein